MDEKKFALEEDESFDLGGDELLDDELKENINNEPEVDLTEGEPMVNVIESDDLDDDEEMLISPDKAIFTKVTTETMHKPERQKGFVETFHGTKQEHENERIKKEKESFVIDEQYASSVDADKHFMQTFGIGHTGSYKTSAGAKDESFGNDDIHSKKYEFTDPSQRTEIRELYKYVRRVTKRKLVFTFIFTALLFLQENVFCFLSFRNFDALDIDAHPYVHMSIGLVALLFCAFFAREQLYHGIRTLIKKDYAPESVVVLILLAAICHWITTLIFVIFVEGSHPVMFNFPAAAVLFGSILFTYFNVKRERYGFGVVSAKRSKFVLEKVNESNAEAEYDTFTTTSNGEFNGQISRVTKTPFVKNYFLNTNKPVKTNTFLKFYYIFAVAVPVVLAIIAAFIEGDPYHSLTYFFVGTMFTLPVGILFTYSVPFLMANSNLRHRKVAILGEEAIHEFASVDAIVVNDTTAFPPKNVKLKNIMGYNDYTIERITYLAASGFSVVGGPLADVFDAVLNDALPKSSRARFVCAGRSYLSVSVDGHSVIFADKYGMTAQGIEVGSEREDKTDMSVMYMACDGVLCSKMYIRYDINQEFVKASKQMNKKNMSIGVRTFDPNINNDLINKLTGLTKKDIRVIKLDSISDIPTPTQRCDGKIVSKGTSSALLKAVLTCKRILKTRKVLTVLKIMASINGSIYLGLAAFGVIDLFARAQSSVIVLLYLLMTYVMYITSLIFMPSKK